MASGPGLCQQLVQAARVTDARTILEFGTGTGAVTEEICRRKRADASLIGFEINRRFAEAAQKRCPDAEVISGCVTSAVRVLRERRINYCDSVVCGLPWATFSSLMQDRFLRSALTVLRAEGYFATFAYVHGLALPGGRQFNARLQQSFRLVDRTDVIWANVPPAVVYIAQK